MVRWPIRKQDFVGVVVLSAVYMPRIGGLGRASRCGVNLRGWGWQSKRQTGVVAGGAPHCHPQHLDFISRRIMKGVVGGTKEANSTERIRGDGVLAIDEVTKLP